MNVKNVNYDKVVIVLFFIFLFLSLFIGDGKQPFVDVWWALGILTMYGVRYYQRGKLDLQHLPRSIGFVWIILIVYYIILTPFSDSAGYSTSATIRLIEGYLVYVMFLTLALDSQNQEPSDSRKQTVDSFTKGLLVTGAVATLASFVFLAFPSLARALPPMNLLYANYGHNHLAGLLLFMFPVAIGAVEKKKNIWVIGALGLFSVGFILTFARGAWILLVFYVLFLVVRNKSTTTRRVGLLVTAAATLALLGVSLISLKEPTHRVGFVGQLVRQAQKTTLFEDNRWEYWRQSIEAIKERPLFGSGPGTFYLLSRRLQSRPDNWSWFAHSFPLQTAAETGLVGLFLFSILMFFIVKGGLQKNLLWRGALLILLYSSYEFSLDYASVWIVLCATLGVLARRQDHQINPRQNTMIYGALIVLGAFYISSLGSLAATALNNNNLGFYLAPYDKKAALGFLQMREEKNKPFTARAMRIIDGIFTKDSDILLSLYENSTTAGVRVEQKLLSALSFDPHNYMIAIRVARYFSEIQKYNTQIDVYKKIKDAKLTQNQKEEVYQELTATIGKIKEDEDPTTLYEAYRLIFEFNPWDAVVINKKHSAIEQAQRLIRDGKKEGAISLLSTFTSFWNKGLLASNRDQQIYVAQSHTFLGEILEKEGKTLEAINALNMSLGIDPYSPITIRTLAKEYIKNGNIELYQDLVRGCVDLFPKQAWCRALVVDNSLAAHWKAEAVRLQEKGNTISSVRLWRLASYAYPFGGEYYRPLVEALVHLGYPDEAIEVVQRCIEHNRKYDGERWCNDFIKR